MRRRPRGCCPRCVDGASGEECTGGLCWDCQGTGHAHSGRCRSRFLDWWHLKEGAVVWTALLWTLLTTAFGAPLLIGTPWVGLGAVLSVGPALLAIVDMIVLGRLADNQIRKHGLPPARTR